MSTSWLQQTASGPEYESSVPPKSIEVVDKYMYAFYHTIPRLPGDNDMWNIYMNLPSKVMTNRPDPHNTIRVMFTLMPCNEEQKKAWQTASMSDRQTQEDITRKEFANAAWQAERLLDAMHVAPISTSKPSSKSR